MFFIVNVVAHFHFGQGRNRMQTLQKRFQCVLTLISAQQSRRVLFVLTTSSGRNHTLKFQVRQVCFKNGVFPMFFFKKQLQIAMQASLPFRPHFELFEVIWVQDIATEKIIRCVCGFILSETLHPYFCGFCGDRHYKFEMK